MALLKKISCSVNLYIIFEGFAGHCLFNHCQKMKWWIDDIACLANASHSVKEGLRQKMVNVKQINKK